jgi:hypothetical protein
MSYGTHEMYFIASLPSDPSISGNTTFVINVEESPLSVVLVPSNYVQVGNDTISFHGRYSSGNY